MTFHISVLMHSCVFFRECRARAKHAMHYQICHVYKKGVQYEHAVIAYFNQNYLICFSLSTIYFHIYTYTQLRIMCVDWIHTLHGKKAKYIGTGTVRGGRTDVMCIKKDETMKK